ncbi:uroporphyrinogen decarboxylase family protein [Opitutus sp. ER46]|uniref:uroporphyrinogen decarboxylase family protein n=1 Tax=Opitutus sp. ER46 TaxID=2161864 RepID=UPI001304B620|nr:uroporphyrinogen decarboxylase family protein [Opitutus sp. ER46]
MPPTFDITRKDAMAMPVRPIDPAAFDFARYEAFAAEADARFHAFLQQQDGIAVWQRVRAGEVFRDACRDMRESLRWQIGALQRTLDYRTDAPTYLEPWYGIGTTAAAFGATYEWLPGQAPVVMPAYASVADIPNQLEPRPAEEVPILRYTLETIEYFLSATQGRVPISWCDLQAPINAVGGIVELGQFLELCYDEPQRAQQILGALRDEIIRFTRRQSALLGNTLARPGHGFASSRAGMGIALSTDNLVMISPAMLAEFCSTDCAQLGAAFGGVGIHSCGNWARWIDTVKSIPNLCIVDGAFSPQTDPGFNDAATFRDALVGTGIILHARIVGDRAEVMSRVRQLWKPGLKLIVGTHIEDPAEQHATYEEIHALDG